MEKRRDVGWDGVERNPSFGMLGFAALNPAYSLFSFPFKGKAGMGMGSGSKQRSSFPVIPAKAGIHAAVDSRLRGNDDDLLAAHRLALSEAKPNIEGRRLGWRDVVA
jgi:hypothetical protein